MKTNRYLIFPIDTEFFNGGQHRHNPSFDYPPQLIVVKQRERQVTDPVCFAPQVSVTLKLHNDMQHPSYALKLFCQITNLTIKFGFKLDFVYCKDL